MEEESENTFNDGRLGISRPHHEPLMRSVSEFGFNHRPSRLRLPPGLQHQSRSCTYSLNAARQRTISLNLNCNVVNTEREPILLNENSNKTIFVQGRPPWFGKSGTLRQEPFIIGISGGSASGKTTVATNIIKQLDVQWVTLISMDAFYRVLNEEQHEAATRNDYNFDHPDAFDFPLLLDTLKRLKEYKEVKVPIYNFVTHRREARTIPMYGATVIIFEGIFAFHDPEVRQMLNLKIFVDADADTRLCRRLIRDTKIRGRDFKSVIEQHQRHVQPAFKFFIEKTMVFADIIFPSSENTVACDLVVQHVQAQLLAKGVKLREELASSEVEIGFKRDFPANLHVLPATCQIRGLLTYIRNRNTPRDEFTFYAKRLIRLVIEKSLSLMPFEPLTVTTPQGQQYNGLRTCPGASKVCGVSIICGGEPLEDSLKDVCKDVRVGKILIQTNPESGEPELYYLKLPDNIKDYRVILMDAAVATGAAAMMAIRVLVDHDVSEENITLVSLLMAVSGVHTIAYAFKNVQMVTSEVDPSINPRFQIEPGFGDFADRYFGTECERY